MNSTRYTYEVKDTDESTHYGRLLRRVGKDKAVLELGSSTGYLSEVMTKEFGCRVYGVEIDPVAAKEAATKCAEVKVADLDTSDLTEMFPDQLFDVAFCADVLEHLRNPERTLKQVKQLLKPGGYVIASIPNISHGSVRLALCAGRFPYRAMGLLDDTHVKFFTRQLVEEVFDQAGFQLESVERNRWNAFTTEVADSLTHDRYFDTLSQSIALDPESETYQFIIRASHKKQHGADHAGKNLPKALELIVVEQPGAPLDDLYRNYLYRLSYPKERLSTRFVNKTLTTEAIEQAQNNSKAYADHDFRTFRFLKQGVQDTDQTESSPVRDWDNHETGELGFGEDLGRGLRRALELASSSKAEVAAICLSNTLPGLNALQRMTEHSEKDTLVFARPEVVSNDEAILQTNGKVSWQIPSLFLLHPQTAGKCLELWKDSDFKTIEAQSANFCFSMLAGGITLKSIEDSSCFRIGPIIENAKHLRLIDGIKLRLSWGNRRHRLSFLKNCVLPSKLDLSQKAKLSTAVLLGAGARNPVGPQSELITFGGFGASIIGAHSQTIGAK